MIQTVLKRDGRTEPFELNKIELAIRNAAESVGEESRDLTKVIKKVQSLLKDRNQVKVEEIQNITEQALVESKEYKISKAFILYRQKRAEVRKVAVALGVKDSFHLPLNTLQVLASRYFIRNSHGEIIETPKELFQRVAKIIAEVDKQYGATEEEVKQTKQEFYDVMTSFEFMPNSPTLMNAGTPLGQLAACFVLPIGDSIEGIFDSVKWAALIHKSGGGTGFSFSNIRPNGDIVKSTGGIASGPLSFIKVFDAATQAIKQGGKRRGANMAVLKVTHPDILDFITAKTTEGEMANFNISVAVTNSFMQALESDDYYWLLNPRTGKRVKQIKARQPWDLIIIEAWKSGDPGVIFLDTINNSNSNCIPKFGPIESTNPCVTGDTLIFTPYGNFPIKSLVGKETEVYTKGINGITIRKALNIRKTGTKKVITIKTLRGDLTLTPEHYVLVKQGQWEFWLQAKNLKPKMKVVGFRKGRVGDRTISIGFGNKFKPEHRVVAEYFLGNIKNKDVHHKDGDTFNNLPENLEIIEHDKHSSQSNVGHPNWVPKDSKTGRFLKKEQKQKPKQRYIYFGKTGKNWIVSEIVDEGKTKDVFNMEVLDTKCFIANGIVIHNCGEIPLYSWESCNLGSINLSKMVTKQNDTYEIDWIKLEKTVRVAVHFLDNVIDANKYPLPKIEEKVKAGRRIGLGVMGFADMLILLGISYNSEKAVETAELVMGTIQNTAHDESMKLGRIRGNFPEFKNSIWHKKQYEYMRNCATTGIAPTGTIAIIAVGCSSGIEPLFAIAYTRHVGETLGTSLLEVNQLFESIAIKEGFYNEELIDKISRSTSIQEIKDIPLKIRKLFVTAHDISPEWHVRMQAIFQKYTDNAVSKTINFPEWASPREIEEAYLLAYKLGCKGITVYRDKCKKVQVLSEVRVCQECVV